VAVLDKRESSTRLGRAGLFLLLVHRPLSLDTSTWQLSRSRACHESPPAFLSRLSWGILSAWQTCLLVVPTLLNRLP